MFKPLFELPVLLLQLISTKNIATKQEKFQYLKFLSKAGKDTTMQLLSGSNS